VSDLSVEAVRKTLRGRYGTPYRYLRVTGSTNSDALQWAGDGVPEGALVVAEEQRTGRGRMGRRWVAPAGSALLFSLVLRPRSSMDLLTTVLGIACAEGIEEATGLGAGLKWPNDVTIGGRKVAGILVESQTAGQDIVAVAGVGINVFWPRGEMPEATSIAAELERRGKHPGVSRALLLSGVLAALEAMYPVEEPQHVIERAEARSTVLGKDAVVRLATGDVLEGTATRLLPNGALAVLVDGREISVTAGEIERVRVAGVHEAG
jgi:BirA family transcriptional regulator, biotin operon repressor / biotin---[acetyl-CoA-carboxylase] ligase